jgi:peptidyl-prolyl cis-trans isomerase C
MKMKHSLRLALAGAAVSLSCLVAAQDAPEPSDVVVSGPAGQVTLAELELMTNEAVPLQHRAEFWSSPDNIARMARILYVQRAAAQAAEKENLGKDGAGALYLKLMRERALTELLMQQRVRAKTPDSKALDGLARIEYKAKPERFAAPEQIHARHILLAVAKDGSDDAKVKAQAEDLIAQLRHGADFAKLAQEYSTDKGSAARGGDLGFFQRGRMVPPFEDAAFALQKKGDLSAPVKTQFGYHIIELVERKPADTQPFDAVLPTLREEMLSKLNSEERAKTWSAIEAEGKVDDEAVARVVKTKSKKD